MTLDNIVTQASSPAHVLDWRFPPGTSPHWRLKADLRPGDCKSESVLNGNELPCLSRLHLTNETDVASDDDMIACARSLNEKHLEKYGNSIPCVMINVKSDSGPFDLEMVLRSLQMCDTSSAMGDAFPCTDPGHSASGIRKLLLRIDSVSRRPT